MSYVKDDSLRTRAPNFSITEKTLLLNIISNFKNIIENKRTNATTWREKDLAWTKVTAAYNSQNQEGHHRAKEALKKYYENIKKTIRKEIAEEKKEINKTGGGTYIIKDNPIKELALNLMNKKTVFGLSNNFDGDSTTADVKLVEPSLSPNIVLGEYEVTEEHSYTKTYDEGDKIEEDSSENLVLQDSAGCSSILTGHEPPSNSIDTRRGLKRTFLPISEVNPFSGHVSGTKTPCLKNKWTTRRRPTPQLQSDLNKEYSETAKVKRQCFEEELLNIQARREQERALFELKKENLLLDIELKKQQLKKFHNQ